MIQVWQGQRSRAQATKNPNIDHTPNSLSMLLSQQLSLLILCTQLAFIVREASSSSITLGTEEAKLR